MGLDRLGTEAPPPERSPPVEAGKGPPGHSDPDDLGTSAARFTLGMVAVFLGLIAGWMFWIVQKFLNGGGWFDLIVGLVLDELILALGLFALASLIWAVFVPAWLARVVRLCNTKLTWAIILIVLLFAGTILFFIVAGVILFLIKL